VKKIYLLVLILGTFSKVNAQEVEWLSFEEAISANKSEPKLFLIDVYTNWCGYCKKMDRDTYGNKIIASYINKNYHAVKLNAEQRESIEYKGKKYKFIENGKKGYHEFAVGLLQGNMSYPSTLILTEKESLIQNIPGFLDPEIMMKILVFFAEGAYKSQKWEDFEEQYQKDLEPSN